MITILAGGTGSVKFVRGLISQTRDVNVVCNVGDNYWLYGLYVCPDIDTIIYGLADILDYEKGWGIRKDTFGFLRQMEIFGEETWFRIGDRDAATHLIRCPRSAGLEIFVERRQRRFAPHQRRGTHRRARTAFGDIFQRGPLARAHLRVRRRPRRDRSHDLRGQTARAASVRG